MEELWISFQEIKLDLLVLAGEYWRAKIEDDNIEVGKSCR